MQQEKSKDERDRRNDNNESEGLPVLDVKRVRTGSYPEERGGVLLLNKPIGMTPLQLIQSFRARCRQKLEVADESEETEPTKKQKKNEQEPKIGYAGRLDPMARGLMVCLVGEANRRQKQHELLTKDYQFDVLFGLSTDTFDVLGLVDASSESWMVRTSRRQQLLLQQAQRQKRHRRAKKKRRITDGEQKQKPTGEAEEEEEEEREDESDMWKETQLLSEEWIRNMLPSFLGERNQKYPPFSSVRVKGKPLFHWAKMGKEKLEEMSPFVPSVRVTVMDLKLLDCYWLDLETLQRIVRERIGSVKSSSCSSSSSSSFSSSSASSAASASEETFRQTEILQSWNDLIFTPLEHLWQEKEEEYEKERGENNREERRRTTYWSWPVFRMKATVTSGTYIRSLADEMGRALSLPEEEGEEGSGGVGAIAFDIYRTRVGQHIIDDALSPPFFDTPSK